MPLPFYWNLAVLGPLIRIAQIKSEANRYDGKTIAVFNSWIGHVAICYQVNKSSVFAESLVFVNHEKAGSIGLHQSAVSQVSDVKEPHGLLEEGCKALRLRGSRSLRLRSYRLSCLGTCVDSKSAHGKNQQANSL